MALLWRYSEGHKTYEVRAAGASVRLYTNGVFHSQFNPRRPISGNLWNMLALPGYLYRPSQSLRRIAVLGVGGGAVVRHLLQMAPHAQVTGVDLDKVHLHIAQSYFGLGSDRVHLHHGDAIPWLEQYDGPPFDLVIDDLFGETKDHYKLPQRAVAVTSTWLAAAQAHLTSTGILAYNLESPLQAEGLVRANRALQSPFPQILEVTSARYENVVAALLPRQLTRDQLTGAVAEELIYRRMLRNNGLPYQFRLHACV